MTGEYAGNARPPSSTSRMRNLITRLPIVKLIPHLTCALCSGYMIDATTVVECLHSFCRSCLLRYLESSSHCPRCDAQITKPRLHEYIKADHTLQDLIYKLVPGLYKSELRRRKEFYLEQCKNASDSSSSADVRRMQIFDKHLLELSTFICTPDEVISFSLETVVNKDSEASQKTNSGPQTVNKHSSNDEAHSSDSNDGIDRDKTSKVRFKRYFRCTAAVTIAQLKKLLAHKLDVPSLHQIEILHSDEPLLDDYTLMDIAYIYTWRRRAPLQLFFNVCKYEAEDEPMPLLVPEVASPIATPDVKSELTIDESVFTSERQNSTVASSSAAPVIVENPIPRAKAPEISVALKNPQKPTPPIKTVKPDLPSKRPSPKEVSSSSSMIGKPPRTLQSLESEQILPSSTKKTPTKERKNSGSKSESVKIKMKRPQARVLTVPKLLPATDNPAKSITPAESNINAPVTSASVVSAAATAAVTSTTTASVVTPVKPPISTAPQLDSTSQTFSSNDSSSSLVETPKKLIVDSSDSSSPVTSGADSAVSPNQPQPSATVANSCTQPAKIRHKKSLSSVVQQLNGKLETPPPLKRYKLDDSTTTEAGLPAGTSTPVSNGGEIHSVQPPALQQPIDWRSLDARNGNSFWSSPPPTLNVCLPQTPALAFTPPDLDMVKLSPVASSTPAAGSASAPASSNGTRNGQQQQQQQQQLLCA